MNKYKLINLNTNEEHLCDKLTIDGFDYYISGEFPSIGDKSVLQIKGFDPMILTHFEKCEPDYEGKKIIATTNPNIDISKAVAEVDELAKDLDKSKCRNFKREYTLKEVYEGIEDGFILGYNKAKETYQFNEEDMIEFAEWITEKYSMDITGKYAKLSTKELFQLWKEQQPKIVYYE